MRERLGLDNGSAPALFPVSRPAARPLYSFFWPASVAARPTPGSRLHADDQSEDDGTQLIEHPDPRHQVRSNGRADSDGQTDHCADPD
jgi:hypothetical protein